MKKVLIVSPHCNMAALLVCRPGQEIKIVHPGEIGGYTGIIWHEPIRDAITTRNRGVPRSAGGKVKIDRRTIGRQARLR